MRKLIWCGVGCLVALSVHRALRYAEARPESPVGRQVRWLTGYSPGDEREQAGSESACVASCCKAHGPCPAAAEVDADGPEPQSPHEVIDLAASVPAPAAIVIPDPEGEEPPLALPEPGTEASDAVARVPVPPVMPYCEDDDDAPAPMPYADGEAWPRSPAQPVKQAGWFEEPAGADSLPACREDENLFRHYPGCPFSGGAAPRGTPAPDKAAPPRHEKDPVFPLPPDVDGRSLPPPGEGGVPEAARRPAGELLRHTVLKIWKAGDGDTPARQPVDTLEVRPGDLRRDGKAPEPF